MCKRLDLSEQQYQFWLGVLFMMLSTLDPRQPTLFDGIVTNLFTNRETAVGVTISRYTKHKCLLSDRGFSSSIAVTGVDCIEFNLRHDAFIRYVFTRREGFVPRGLLDPRRRRRLLEQMAPTLVVDYRVDDLDQLRMFNLNVINQSHGRVFCATDTGIEIHGM